jgi:TolA-binding protein
MGDLKEALKLYQEAARKNENENTSPMYLFKAGLVAEELKDFEKATELYEQIRDEYSVFASQKNIDKYIGRVSNQVKK